MPCRDYYPENETKIVYRDSAKTIEELCELRTLVLELAKAANIENEKILKIKEKQIKHRLEDKKRFILKLESSIKKIKRDIETIKSLGGEPNSEILDKLLRKQNTLNQIKDINGDDILDKSKF